MKSFFLSPLSLCFWLSLISVVCAIESCSGPAKTGPGPIYKLNAPVRRDICLPSGQNKLFRVHPDSCFLGACWLRNMEEVDSIRLIVRGRVLSSEDCQPVKNGVVDVWQTDASGMYGSPHPDKENGHCRGRVLADARGKYEYETDLPGAYGLLSVMSPRVSWWPQGLPPYLPSHIHVTSWGLGHNVMSTQLYLPDDVGRHHDLRSSWFGVPLGAEDSRNVMNLTREGNRLVTVVDLILIPNASLAFTSADEAITHAMCSGSSLEDFSLPLCWPEATWIMSVAGPVMIALLLGAVVIGLIILRSIVGFVFVLAVGKGRAGQNVKKSKAE